MPSTTIRTRGADLIVNDVGSGEPAFVFLHYWGGSARTWGPVIERLPPAIRAVAIDQRGWGGSRVTDGRYDLDALAEDVMALTAALGLSRYVIVGHSMGAKVAQLVASQRPVGLAGLVLVAPAPPQPMPVPADVRAGMVASYQSRDGVMEALQVLGGAALSAAHRDQVIEDTLRGTSEAKRVWPESGMTADLGAAVAGLRLPVEVLIGANDVVERPSILQPLFSRLFPPARFTVIPGAGHLLPLETPNAIADSCVRMRGTLQSDPTVAADA